MERDYFAEEVENSKSSTDYFENDVVGNKTETTTEPITPTSQETPTEKINFFDLFNLKGDGSKLPTPEEISKTNPYMGAVAKTGQEMFTVPAHFFNQRLFNTPRSISNKLGIQYPETTSSPVANIGAKALGLTGALTTPVKNVIAGAALYAPENDPLDMGQRAKQGLFGAIFQSAAKPIEKLGVKYGKPALAKVISTITGTPEDSAMKLVANPNFASKSWIKKESASASDAYSKVVKPLIDDPNAIVNTANLTGTVSNLGLTNATGQATKVASSMSKLERKMIDGWVKKIQQGKMTFNEADALIAEIDANALSSHYNKIDKSKVSAVTGKPVTDSFERVSKMLRGALNAERKTQFPDAGNVLDRISTVKTASRVFRDFDRLMPKMIPALAALGMSGAGAAARAVGFDAIPGALAATSPKINSLAVLLGSKVGKQAGKAIPTAVRISAERLARQNRQG